MEWSIWSMEFYVWKISTIYDQWMYSLVELNWLEKMNAIFNNGIIAQQVKSYMASGERYIVCMYIWS
jgi:hypothetical protein